MLGDEAAQRNADAKEREKWAKKIFELLVKIKSPFGIEAMDKGWSFSDPEASRCLRGLRAGALRKRFCDFGPFLRYLKGTTGKDFPTERSDIVTYLCGRRSVRPDLSTAPCSRL